LAAATGWLGVLEITAVSAEQVGLIPQCAECNRLWLPDDGDRWRAYFDRDDELVFYCPDCVDAEFGKPG
jgi:hypothetical protein